MCSRMAPSQRSVLHIGHWMWMVYPLFFMASLCILQDLYSLLGLNLSSYCFHVLDMYKTPVSFFGAFDSVLLSLVHSTCPTPLKIPFPHAKLAV